MSVDPIKDDGLDLLLQEIAKNLDENQRFIKGLKDDSMGREIENDETSHEEEAFEEL
ncbi:MAG: hypothetical protein OEL57_15885 [Trichlorobacter sp.]|uniref:hypothetical protein n=1 Tax=Trichlorobacter sp. TaxID=2911007 RepID=UPI00256E63FD|nr:hypothetical protein [Trichlorobacter sp.]MDK9719362.1 hypothetical protein [Trichlorobacter sp.]